jgi:hypothetical protein
MKITQTKKKKPSCLQEAVVRNTSNAPRPPEAKRTGGVTGERDKTLDVC